MRKCQQIIANPCIIFPAPASDASSDWTLVDVPEAAKKQVAAYVMDQMAERSDAKLAYPPSGDWTVYQYVGGQLASALSRLLVWRAV